MEGNDLPNNEIAFCSDFVCCCKKKSVECQSMPLKEAVRPGVRTHVTSKSNMKDVRHLVGDVFYTHERIRSASLPSSGHGQGSKVEEDTSDRLGQRMIPCGRCASDVKGKFVDIRTC